MKSKFSAEERWRLGSLPDPAPLAAAYIPMLDLPFMNLVNPELERTPMTELMAIDFVVDELELYLDTHWEDREAFELYQTMLAMQKEAKERMVRLCGPICQTDQLGMDAYRWLNGPWPWELCERGEG